MPHYTKKAPSPSNQYTDTEPCGSFDDAIAAIDATVEGFANVATIRLLDSSAVVSNGEVRYLRGYTNTNDGRQGPVYYDNLDTTTADDLGTVFVDAAGRRWKRFS